MSNALTLTFGLRYENFGTPVNSVSTAAWAGLFNIDPVAFDGPYRLPNKVKPDRNNFSSMLGLAWSPLRATVFRAGYGIGYDSFFNNIASNAQGGAPNVVATATTSQIDAANPRGIPGLSRAIPAVPRPVVPIDAQSLVPGNLVNPYYQHWSAGVQRELPGDLFNHPQYGYPSVGPFAPGNVTAIGAIAANATSSPAGRFLRPEFVDGGSRVVRYQLKIRF